jgi:hypothetical protein
MPENLGWIWGLDWNSTIDLPYNKIWVELFGNQINTVIFNYLNLRGRI